MVNKFTGLWYKLILPFRVEFACVYENVDHRVMKRKGNDMPTAEVLSEAKRGRNSGGPGYSYTHLLDVHMYSN